MSSARTGNASESGLKLKVGDWIVDPAGNQLSRNGLSTRLEPKAIEVLVCLAQRPGRVVSRDELLSAVWPGVVVGDDALTQAIIKLRKALGDEAHRPTYIETISKRGYRLIAPVTLDKTAEGKGAPESPLPSARAAGVSSLHPRRLFWVAGAAIVLALAMLGIFLGSEDEMRLGGSRSPDRAGASGALPVIAVLPLSNLSADPARDYFSDGVTEDIIRALGRYSALRVISRNSVEPYKDRTASAQAIRGELGARYVVKGSVREADDRVRVSVELSDAETGTVIWSERYEGAGKDVFDIQDRIARDIVGTLAVKVTRLELERASRRSPPASPEAYDLVLRARALVVRSERVANREARALADQALQVAPDYAEAHVVLGEAEYQRFVYGWTEDPEEAVLRAQQHCLRALAIDDPGAKARAHGQLGLIYSAVGKLEQALVEADRAIEINPSDAFALDTRGSTLMWLGRTDEAITAMETAFRFNPAGRGSQSAFDRALAYYTLRRYPESLAAVEAALVQYPNAPLLHAIHAAALAQSGRLDEARKAAARVARLEPFFRSAEFGNRFVNPQHAAHLQDGVRKAGL